MTKHTKDMPTDVKLVGIGLIVMFVSVVIVFVGIPGAILLIGIFS